MAKWRDSASILAHDYGYGPVAVSVRHCNEVKSAYPKLLSIGYSTRKDVVLLLPLTSLIIKTWNDCQRLATTAIPGLSLKSLRN